MAKISPATSIFVKLGLDLLNSYLFFRFDPPPTQTTFTSQHSHVNVVMLGWLAFLANPEIHI